MYYRRVEEKGEATEEVEADYPKVFKWRRK